MVDYYQQAKQPFLAIRHSFFDDETVVFLKLLKEILISFEEELWVLTLRFLLKLENIKKTFENSKN